MDKQRFNIKIKEKIKKVETLLTFRCNNRCVFCSWGHKIDTPDLGKSSEKTTQEVMEDIRFAAGLKASLFSFSGGEPTLRKDLVFLIKYAKERGFKNIQIQTNGRLLSYKKFAQKIIKAGINDIAFTILSIDKKVHDKLTDTKSSFNQAIAGIKNVVDILPDIRLRLNTVITEANYRQMPEITAMLMDLGATEIGYDYVIIDGRAIKKAETLVPRYSQAKPYLREALALSAPKIWTPIFNVPHCCLPGFAARVVDFVQPATLLIGKDFIFSIKENRRKNKSKLPVCQQCKYNKACFGVWDNYLKLYGDQEFAPVEK